MAKRKPRLTYETLIKEDKWTCKLWTARSYIAEHDDESNGITLGDKREIHFREDDFSMSIVAHEVFHAYFKYTHIDSTSNIKSDDAEEIAASLMGSNFIRYFDKCMEIYNAIKSKVKVDHTTPEEKERANNVGQR
jgi:hypothetical protein